MKAARDRLLTLLGAGLPPEQIVDIIIDVVTVAVRRNGGRPSHNDSAAEKSQSNSNGTLPLFRNAAPATELVVVQASNLMPAGFADRQQTSDLTSLSSSESDLNLSLQTQKASSLDRGFYEPGFADFWAMYPRRVGKADAMRAWKRAKPPLEVVMVALVWQIELWSQDEAKFIPHPATWINQGRWNDEKPAQRPPQLSARTMKTADQAEKNRAVAMRYAKP
jgi:hypothetical protein